MKVYLLTWGDYDGGGVEGVFSSKEKAKRKEDELVEKKYYSRHQLDIECWEIDGSVLYETD